MDSEAKGMEASLLLCSLCLLLFKLAIQLSAQASRTLNRRQRRERRLPSYSVLYACSCSN